MPLPGIERKVEAYLEKDKEELAKIAAVYDQTLESINGEAAYWIGNLGEGFACKDRMGKMHNGILTGLVFKVETFRVFTEEQIKSYEDNLEYHEEKVEDIPPGSLQWYSTMPLRMPTRKYDEDREIARPGVTEEELLENRRKLESRSSK